MALPSALKSKSDEIDNYYKNTGEGEKPTPTPTLESEKPTETPKEPQTPPALDNDIDYQAKYKALEGKYRAEVPKLHEQVKQLNSQIQQLSAIQPQDNDKVSQLESQIRELQASNSQLMQTIEQSDQGANVQLNDYLTEEYGEDFAKAVAEQARLIANSETSRVNKELADIKNQFEQSQARATESSTQTALQTLSSMLQAQNVNFSEIDNDPLFHDWLNQTDQLSGMTYDSLMRQAFSQGDLQRTASFYTKYNASQPRSNQNLNEYADPVNTVNQMDSGNNPQPFDPSAFTRLAEDLRARRITRQEYEQKERELFKALNRR